jgi:hypothetical protein
MPVPYLTSNYCAGRHGHPWNQKLGVPGPELLLRTRKDLRHPPHRKMPCATGALDPPARAESAVAVAVASAVHAGTTASVADSSPHPTLNIRNAGPRSSRDGRPPRPSFSGREASARWRQGVEFGRPVNGLPTTGPTPRTDGRSARLPHTRISETIAAKRPLHPLRVPDSPNPALHARASNVSRPTRVFRLHQSLRSGWPRSAVAALPAASRATNPAASSQRQPGCRVHLMPERVVASAS